MTTQIKQISVTDTSGSVSFSSDVDFVTLRNNGTSLCYFNVDATATTTHFTLDPQEELKLGLKDMSAIHAICDTGDTTTLDIIGSTSVEV